MKPTNDAPPLGKAWEEFKVANEERIKPMTNEPSAGEMIVRKFASELWKRDEIIAEIDTAIRESNAELYECLDRMTGEAWACIGLNPEGCRQLWGNTNYAIVCEWVEKSKEALARHGADKETHHE